LRELPLRAIEGGEVLSERELANPGHGPGGPPPRFVANQGADCVLAWGMPPHAQGLFAEAGIRVQLGATGDAREAVRAFLAGTLQLTTEALDAGGGAATAPDPEHDHGHDPDAHRHA
jgi:predicted Fe-Mo cluster-binding NifX family protein